MPILSKISFSRRLLRVRMLETITGMSSTHDRDEFDVRDPRVILAAERTLLAWVRTGLALMGFGFVVARFGLFLRELAVVGQRRPEHDNTGLSQWIGVVLILLGVIVNL